MGWGSKAGQGSPEAYVLCLHDMPYHPCVDDDMPLFVSHFGSLLPFTNRHLDLEEIWVWDNYQNSGSC